MDSSSAAPPRNDDLSCAFCDRNHPSAQVLLITTPPLPLETLAQLRDAFAESNVPYRVDVLDWHAASDPFRNLIAREWTLVRQGG